MSGRFEYGARFEILRTGLSDGVPTYRATVSWPEDNEAVFRVEVRSTGDMVFEAEDASTAELEDWMEAHLRSILKSLVNGGLRTGKWPRRSNVWKASPSQN